MNANEHLNRWKLKAPLSLLLTGFGACLISEAAMHKAAGRSASDWVARGTIALVVFNSGLSLLADAAKHRGHYERLTEVAAPEYDRARG